MRDKFPKLTGNQLYRHSRRLAISGALALTAAGCGGPKNDFNNDSYTVLYKSYQKDNQPAGKHLEVPRDKFNISNDFASNKGKRSVGIAGIIGCGGESKTEIESNKLTIVVPALHNANIEISGCDSTVTKTVKLPQNDPFFQSHEPVDVMVFTKGKFDWAVVEPVINY